MFLCFTAAQKPTLVSLYCGTLKLLRSAHQKLNDYANMMLEASSSGSSFADFQFEVRQASAFMNTEEPTSQRTLDTIEDDRDSENERASLSRPSIRRRHSPYVLLSLAKVSQPHSLISFPCFNLSDNETIYVMYSGDCHLYLLLLMPLSLAQTISNRQQNQKVSSFT